MTQSKPKGIFISEERYFHRVYNAETEARIREMFDMHPGFFTADQIREDLSVLKNVRCIFSTWGMVCMDDELLAEADSLEVVFYAAGSIAKFTTPAFWERDISICSAWQLNAIPVAEYTQAMILMALKNILPTQRQIHQLKKWMRDEPAGNYGNRVGLVSYGAIAKLVHNHLKYFHCPVAVYDPFLSDSQAKAEGIEKMSLDQLFSDNLVISLHTPWLKETEGMIQEKHFRSIPKGGTFINTARGAVVDEEAMIRVLKERPDLTSILDVTYPEPPPAGSPLYELDNVFLTPHIAGSVGSERQRMGDQMLFEAVRWLENQPLAYQVTKDMVARMA